MKSVKKRGPKTEPRRTPKEVHGLDSTNEIEENSRKHAI